tara:strand:- start:971 stop:1213 length:243 start_codon:yes stop_codon:yes gene_type:complete
MTEYLTNLIPLLHDYYDYDHFHAALAHRRTDLGGADEGRRDARSRDSQRQARTGGLLPRHVNGERFNSRGVWDPDQKGAF